MVRQTVDIVMDVQFICRINVRRMAVQQKQSSDKKHPYKYQYPVLVSERFFCGMVSTIQEMPTSVIFAYNGSRYIYCKLFSLAYNGWLMCEVFCLLSPYQKWIHCFPVQMCWVFPGRRNSLNQIITW